MTNKPKVVVHNHTCDEGGSMPTGVVKEAIVKIETQTCIGWVDTTEDFTYTRCGLNYRLHTI